MTTKSAEFLGYAAAFLTTISFLAQAVKTLRSRDTRSISFGLYALFTAGLALCSVYGWLVRDDPVLIANLITMVPATVVLQR